MIPPEIIAYYIIGFVAEILLFIWGWRLDSKPMIAGASLASGILIAGMIDWLMTLLAAR